MGSSVSHEAGLWGFCHAEAIALLHDLPCGGGAVELGDRPVFCGLAFAECGSVPCGDDAGVGLDGEPVGELRWSRGGGICGSAVFLDGGEKSGVHAGAEFFPIRCEAVPHGEIGVAGLFG